MLDKYKTSGMLYFLYNKDVVAVLVCHDIKKGEFVLQVPFFPPIESIEDYSRDHAKCMDIVKKSIFGKNVNEIRDIEIKNVNSWVMEAIVA